MFKLFALFISSCLCVKLEENIRLEEEWIDLDHAAKKIKEAKNWL